MPPQTTPGEYDRCAYVTIQGGGVCGLSLLGQLRALEQHGIVPIALAGTSAGAFVAALHWAGLAAEQIRDRLLAMAMRGEGLTDLLGPFEKRPRRIDFTDLRRLVKRLGRYSKEFYGLFGLPDPEESKWERLRRGLYSWWGLPAFLALEGRAARRDFGILRDFCGRRGAFPGKALEAKIDRLLRDSPAVRGHAAELPRPPDCKAGRCLTFGDFRRLALEGKAALPRLILTATNLSTRRLELFDSIEPRYADLPVATAVRASAGFPFFFQPVDVAAADGDSSYVDGGVISNFPAFVFEQHFRREFARKAEEGLDFALRPTVHIGLRLVGGPRPRVAKELESPAAFFRAMYGLLSGQARNELEERLAAFVSRSVLVEQPYADTGGPDHLLNVGRIDPQTIRVMYERGRRFAEERLGRLSFALPPPAPVERQLQAVRRRAGLVLGLTADETAALRANVFLQQGGELALLYRANMDDPARDTDRDLRFPFRHGLTGFCFVRRRPILCHLGRLAAAFRDGRADPATLFGVTREPQAKVRRDRNWLVSVPVFDPYASSRWELLENPVVGVRGLHYVELNSPVDGPVFGVLNLDAALPFGRLGLPEEPEEQKGDERVLALVDIMRSVANELGNLFSDAFASNSATGGT